ncbi:MAG: anaerobic glycerol-3-phosphate dehydrogenase subunit A [Muribaculaceae bacterium]|nr:anaerobic glycerol-3-phosphate dehydrogenase subunit A [Muribaculaceae bacterium]MBQ7205815.1 anaerobic glycerol-3-phosphate dehydrogenase subunit A [Muribaculaceae bacterium]
MVTNDIYNNEYDVIIIGGGATGAGTARDCALRGLSVLLVERFDYSTGATGRNHGLMHSGARYAVTDGESAEECIKENMTLRRIARHCVEETDGLFITLPEDDLGYQKTFVDACQRAGIRADVIDPEEARRIEPSVNPELIGAVRVPDAAIDPFRLTVANLLDARLHGAVTLNYHEVEGLIVNQARVEGVKLLNHINGERVEVRGRVVVNAAGIWGQRIAQTAGVNISMFPARGALLIFGHRVNHMVINRCRKPANADILVPDDTVCVIGTTSDRIPIETVDDMRVTREEVDILLKEGVKIAPSLATTRVIRAYAGVRPLVASDDDPSGRSISRGIVCLDHAKRDGLEGFITITGGKMMTYRLMAEIATNAVCAKLGNTAPCITAAQPLPGSEDGAPDQSDATKRYSFGQRAAIGRHGSLAARIENENDIDNALVCECEGVTVGEIKYAVHQLHVHNLVNLRRRTRMGMGTCQGKLCSCRAASLLGEFNHDVKRAQEDLADFLEERWKGIRPVAWGDTLREAQLTATIYEGLCGLDKAVNMEGKEDVQ